MGDQVHPGEMGYTVMVMIPKVNVDTQGIRLIEVVWKVVDAVVDTRIKAEVQFHGVLHRSCPGRGTGTSIMELKLAQDLASVYQGPLFLVFLYLWKAYGKLEQGRLLQTLEGYGVGPKIW